ncbi:ABC transporter ATPase [Sphingobacteriaceae bacterium WQ 2009]|uniref:ABC transporter ATPase n=1 Tax=Rhinopithecimicrobium faecis TaxID=2820698 RepID=A0A8T4H8A4_9SPHI|nr:ABC transporter ATPase [Sphingobacteriaceae bacterium WQ 2009]
MARVWIYQANRILSEGEVNYINTKLVDFLADWNAHGAALTATAEVRYQLFVILTVDESKTPPSGCSIDKSVYIMKAIEEALNIQLFDRFQLAYRTVEGDLRVADRASFEALIKQGLISADTIVFNNLVADTAALATQWEVPFNRSWHQQVFG